MLTHSLTRRAFLNTSIASVAGAFVLNYGKSYADAEVPKAPPSNHGILLADFWTKLPPTIRTDSGVQLTLDPSRALIAFEGKLELNEVQQLLRQVNHDLRVEDTGNGQLLHGYFRSGLQVNHLPNQVWVRSQSIQPISPQTITAIAQSFSSHLNHLRWIGPAYRYPHTADQVGVVCALPNVISILPRKGIDSASLDAILLHKFNLLLAQKLTQYLAGFRYYYLPTTAMLFLPTQSTIYDIQRQVSENPSFKKLVAQASFDYLPLISPAQASFSPDDPLYQNPGQWNLNKIHAKDGWESGTLPVLGEGVVVAVIDSAGVQYTHEDFQVNGPTFVQGATFAQGTNQNDPPDINETPSGGESDSDYHGTACAGVIAARYNRIGIAGLAGLCKLMSVRVMGYQSVFVAAAINYASGEGAQTGTGTRSPSSQANVIGMSFVGEPVSGDYLITAEIKTALEKAFDTHHVVLCGSAGNSGHTPPYYPAADSHVMACGASNEADDRCHQADWGSGGSAYGGELSVVAPGVSIRTTDLSGIMGDSNGNYVFSFWRTSAAAPQVAGLAALLMSKYPSLKDDPASVRAIIERTTEKVGRETLGPGTPPSDIPTPLIALTYTNKSGKGSGDWNQETGYGRINVNRALTFADMMIKKHPTDSGLEPYTPPGNAFSDSDIVLSTARDVTMANFDSRTGPSFKVLAAGVAVPHYLYVRITNRGPEAAKNVAVSVRITQKKSTPFIVTDWTDADSTHLTPQGTAMFSQISSGSEVLSEFVIPANDVTTILSWTSPGQGPCVLAKVISTNDYAFDETKDWISGDLLLRKNNLAQATLSFGSSQPPGDQTPPLQPKNLQVL